MNSITPEELAFTRQYLIRNEGHRHLAYRNSAGIPTVGIGFNLLRADAPEKVRALGLDYDRVLKSEQELSNEQIEALFAQDLHNAMNAAAALVPSWAALTAARKTALTDMAFNLGAGGLARFSRFIAAVNRADWKSAAEEITNSLYYRQVGARAERNAWAIRHGHASLIEHDK